MNSSIKNRIASFAIVWCMIFSLFAGLLIIAPSEGEAALPSFLENGDIVIGSDYSMSTWSLSLDGGTHYLEGNLTIRAGGTVVVSNGALSFSQDCGMDRVPGTIDDHIYTLIVEDGGRLVLNHATITTHLTELFDFPSLGVLVQNGASIEATDSSFIFPGHIVIDDSTFVLINSIITGHDAINISKYCNEAYFPSDVFDDSAVIYSISGTCKFIDSSIEKIFEGQGAVGIYTHNYQFASDTVNRDIVTYKSSRSVNGYVNLTMDDLKYATIGPGQTLSIGSVAIDGLVFPASASYSIAMNVKYLTGSGYDGTNFIQYNFENGVLQNAIQPTDTHSTINPSENVERTSTFIMPSMSSAELKNINISFVNNAATASVSFNKIWFTVSYSLGTYRNLTFGGSSKVTGINSFIDVDFESGATHNQLNVLDQATTYLYGVYGNNEGSLASTAYYIKSNNAATYALNKNVLDTTGGALSTLRSLDGTYYTVAQNRLLAIENFNSGDITGDLTGVTLTVSVRATSGYAPANYVQWGTSWSALKNTSIRPVFNTVTPDTYTFDLYKAGIRDIASLNNLKIGFSNTQAFSVQFDRIAVTIETSPSIYIYRWANINVVDEQELPVSGAYVNASLLTDGSQAYYYTSSGIQSTPPIDVLNYVGRNSTDFKISNLSGAVMLPLLSEVLNSSSQLPNLFSLLGYSLHIEYTNITGIIYADSTSVAFEKYPSITEESQSTLVDLTLPGLYLDKPDLLISSMSVVPAIIYVGDTATISVFVRNVALTGAINVAVNVTDSMSGWTSEEIIPFVGPGSTVAVKFIWTATPSGLHTFAAKVDPKATILEGNENNNERSLQVNVLANLPELTVVSGDISFAPQPAFSGSPVTTTVVVSNVLGRADANNVTVSFYVGDPTTSGQLIGSTMMNVARGTANTTSFVWTPTEIGTYNIFVYVNQGRNPQEYSYTNNIASRAIVVDLSIQSTDLVVDNNDVLVFSGTDFNHRGRIIVMDQGTLKITNAKFTVDQDFDNQFQVYVMDNGKIILESAEFTSTNSVWMYLNEGAKVWVNDSILSDMVKVKLDGSSALSVDASSIGAEIVAPTSSSASLTARDSSFAKPLSSFGGNARAMMFSISIPSMSAKESSRIYNYRTIDVTVTDDANNIIAGATVRLSWYVNGTVVKTSASDLSGKVSFDALCDIITLSGSVYYGTYVLNCSYSFIGTSYYADDAPVSLEPYSSPLAINDPQVTLVLNGVVPLSGWDLIISGTNVVTLEGTSFTHRGRIIIMDSGTLRITNAGLTINQAYDNEFQIFVQDNGKLEMSTATLGSSKSIWVYVSGSATFTADTSTISAAIKISLADNAAMTVKNSTVGSNIMAPDGSNAILKAYNTTFQTSWTAFGGNARAYLYGVSIPAIHPVGGAVVLNYRWVEVMVLDGNGYPIPNTVVQMRYYLNGTLFDTHKTKSNGKALFAAPCDRIDATNNNFLGNYKINATYWYAGVAYQTVAPSPVSLPPYSEPLVDQLSPRILNIPGALPNLDPPLYASSNNPYRGDEVTLTTYVKNSGVVDANNVVVRFKDESLTIADVVVAKITPGSTATVRTTWLASLPLSQHNISVVIDPDNLIKELNENDNTNWTLINVRGIADLYISASDVSVLPSSPTTNSTTSVTLVVHNNGDVAAINVNVSFVDIRPSGSQVLLGYRIISNVPANGGTGSTSLTWVPNIPGNHNLLIKVNVGVPPVVEHSTSDNNVTYPVTVLNYADLTPSGLTFRPSTTIYVNHEMFVDAAISNIGQSNAVNVIVNFWEGSVGTGTLFDTETIALIPAGQTVEVTGIWQVMPTGNGKIETRTIMIDVNPSHTIIETNFNNNRLVQTTDVVDNRPDLLFVGGMNVTSGGVEVNEAVVGENVVLKVSVLNDGYTPAMSVKIRFDAIDADSFVTNIGTVSRDIDANETIDVELHWVVNVTSGNYTLNCTLDSVFMIEEINENNNALARDFVVNPPEPEITVSTDRNSYGADQEVLIFGKVTNSINGDPLANVKLVISLVAAQTKVNIGGNVTVYTNTKGEYSTSRPIPSNAASDDYAAEVEVHVGDRVVTEYSAPFDYTAPGTETEVPLWIWILIIVLVLAVIVIFSFLMYRKLGRLVECGECGALIPESSKKCPKCGVEFETGTAKCSQCGAWIPASSTECPECGAKFVTEPLAEEESEYIRNMREQYEAYVNPYREQAKQILGKKYSEAKFQEWWKKQPSYMSFEKWLSQEEEKRKASGTPFPCPVCGTLNPRGANICSKCGTVFDRSMIPEAGATTAEPSKPTRRIVKRPAEKKAAPKKEEGGEQLEQPEEPKNQ